MNAPKTYTKAQRILIEVSIWRESEVQAWLDGQFAHHDSKGGTQ